MSDEDNKEGTELDARIREALREFEERISALEHSAKTDVRDIEAAFLDRFYDGAPLRAAEAPTWASAIAVLLADFVKRRSEVIATVARILVLKDLAVDSAHMRLAAEEADIGVRALEELPVLFHWMDELRAGRDPGTEPEFATLGKVTGAQQALDQIRKSVNEAGNDVATNIEMLADIVDLRIEYLHEFKLANLPLSPQETLERIMRRFEQQPKSVARRAALELLKGSVVAIVMPLVERQLPWSIIVDMFERFQMTVIGPRLGTAPSGTDALLNMKQELTDQARVLEVLLADCLRLEEKLKSLSSGVLEPLADATRH